jgi:hypothetical protein
MRSKRIALQMMAALMCIAAIPSDVLGNEQLIILPTQTVKSLDGIVVVNGLPLEHAVVAECASDYQTEIRRTTTDAQGRFSMPRVKGRETYYLQITGPGPGINPARVKVQINRRGKALLNIPLHLA